MSDDDLARLLEEAERRRAMLAGVADEDEAGEAGEREREGDPCPHCGEPALGLDECRLCGEDGCLPRDDWMPGDADPCLTRCARCGSHVHLDCAGADAADNMVCCGPRYARDDEDEAR